MGFGLTAIGRGVLGGAVVLYAVGVVLGYADLVAVGGGGLVALALGVALVARRPRVAITRRAHPDRIVVGATAQALVVVTNRGRATSPPFTAVDRVAGGEVPIPVPAIARGATVRLPYTVPGRRRGRVQLGPIVVTRVDPLGLVCRRQPHAAGGNLWVHPRTHPAAPVPTGLDVELEGAPVDTAPRGAVTFASLREYVPGDDVRRIHWRSTARTGTLMVRDQIDTSQPRTTVALDGRADRWTESSFEAGVEVVASVARAAERAGHPAVLVAAEPAAPSVAPEQTPTSVLDRLSLVTPSAEAGPTILDRLEVLPPGGAVVVVTGRPDGPTATRVAGLRRRFSLVVLIQIAPDVRARSERRPALLVLTADSGRAALDLWNRTVGR